LRGDTKDGAVRARQGLDIVAVRAEISHDASYRATLFLGVLMAG
jgi:hypothetical protein